MAVESISGCRFYYRVWILLQGVDSVTGCGFYYRVWILFQGVDSVSGCGSNYYNMVKLNILKSNPKSIWVLETEAFIELTMYKVS